MASSYLVDTNVMLRLTKPDHPEHTTAANAVGFLIDHDHELFFTLQNASEFWNVCTRSTVVNGLGLSSAEANRNLNAIEQNFTLLADSILVYDHRRILVVQHSVSGIQVHDAKLVAAMLAHGVGHILTFNTKDFIRYESITAVHPSQINS